jgi:glucose-6-phosphate dehydrogenase assembly protein OpcA
MEKAVSSSNTSNTGEIKLREFERGNAIEVPVGRIESELSALWRRAAEARPGTVPKAVTRACLWNLVIRVQGEEQFARAKRLVDELSLRLPARTIICRSEGAQADGLRAWVEANWRRREGGGEASGSDEVTLWAGGQQVERLPSLIRALLYADAPTAMFWPGPLPAAEAPMRELLHQADRLIVDTRKLENEPGLAELCAIGAAEPDLEIADMSWLGISPLRGMCAALFDLPRARAALAKLDRVRVTSNIHGTQARGLLALGWLMSRLGWTAARRLPDAASTRRWQAARPDGQSVTLELSTRPAVAQINHGVAALELWAGGDAWSLTRDQCIHVRGPELPPRTQPARSHTDPELLAVALGAKGRDRIYKEALAQAAALVEART